MSDKPSEYLIAGALGCAEGKCHCGISDPSCRDEAAPILAFALRAAQTELLLAKREIQSLKCLPKIFETKASMCAHNRYWVTHFGNCMACRSEKAESQVEALKADCDAEMERVKACELIAEGETGWEKVSNLCPSTGAVSKLRLDYDGLLAAMGEKDNILEHIQTIPCNAPEFMSHHLDERCTYHLAEVALSTTPQDSLARLRNEAKAEAFEEAAKMAPGSSSGSSLRREFNRIAIDLRTAEASGKREEPR